MTLLQDSSLLKKTPLYDRHISLGGKMVDFSGWSLPVYYTGILAEHQWVRQHCGFFDVSHLGEIRVKGRGALQFLQYRLTNDLNRLQDGRILYSLLCDEQGFTLDDILVYRVREDDYFLIVNAANIGSDLKALEKYAPESLELEDCSDQTSCIAVQGPESERILEALFGFGLSGLRYYSFVDKKFMGGLVWISRSGYTGEDGFEIFGAPPMCLPAWDALVGEGRKQQAMPAGLGARNTLRLEAGNPLYGAELDSTTTPLEAKLHFAVSFQKGGFVGRDRLIHQKEKGASRQLVGFRMLDKRVAREHYRIFKDGRKVGGVTSGSYGPTVGCNIGLGYVSVGIAAPGTLIEIEIHGQKAPAEIVKLPFVAAKHKKSD